MKNTTIIIPTRLKAKRFPNKPLAKINNIPMILHTLNRGLESGVGEVYVATPDNEILEIIKQHGGKAILTGNHPNGTSRVFEAFKKIKNEKTYTIAYHSACSMQHGQKIHDVPINLIQKTGNEVLDIPDGHLCCGSAGTYNLLQSDIANRLLKNKISNIEKIKPQIISTGNIGCITQIAQATKIPILHTVEIIDWYTGGPKPKILKN